MGEKESILPHQQRIVEKLLKADQPGLVLMHGLGSGKTRSSIEAYKALGLPAEVVVPAALRNNYEKELNKWVGKVPKNINIRSQQEIARKGIDPKEFAEKLMIIDEAHRLRNEATKLYGSLRDVSPAKRLLLTGTPIYNHPSDIAKLVNLASGERILPEDKKSFEAKYLYRREIPVSLGQRFLGVTSGEEIAVKNPEYLKKLFKKYIDYHAGNSEGFPQIKDEYVHVPMHERQSEIYKAVMRELPWALRMKVKMGLAPNKREIEKLIPFLTGARMISNSTAGFEKNPNDAVSPKIEKAFAYLNNKLKQDPKYKALIYSHYLDSGINPYKQFLDKAKIPYGEFTGEISSKVRNKLVQDYNANKLRALLVSSAGGEGLDLKGTRLVQLLEPHFNNEKLKQVIGRAARYKSHEGLSPIEQNVLVQHYLASALPNRMERIMGETPTSADEYLQGISDRKEKLNEEFLKLIR